MNVYTSEYTPTFQKLSRKKNNNWNEIEAKPHSHSKKAYRLERGAKRAWEMDV